MEKDIPNLGDPIRNLKYGEIRQDRSISSSNARLIVSSDELGVLEHG